MIYILLDLKMTIFAPPSHLSVLNLNFFLNDNQVNYSKRSSISSAVSEVSVFY